MGFYNWLSEILPLKRIFISLFVGIVTLLIVLYAGLNSEFVRIGTVVERAFSAFTFTGLLTFIILMSCEEYGIYRTKRELEAFIDLGELTETGEEFDRAEYLQIEAEPTVEPEPVVAEDNFRPMNFSSIRN